MHFFPLALWICVRARVRVRITCASPVIFTYFVTPRVSLALTLFFSTAYYVFAPFVAPDAPFVAHLSFCRLYESCRPRIGARVF